MSTPPTKPSTEQPTKQPTEQPTKQPTKPSTEPSTSMFRSYGSIDLPKPKIMEYICRNMSPNPLFVAHEKVHGANFSIGREADGEFWCARRRAKLLAGEQFYGWETLTDKLSEYYDALCKNMIEEKQALPDDLIIVRGELCGGNYPDMKCSKSVQSGVYYANDVRFIVFDIEVVTKGYIDVLHAMELAERAGFTTVPFIMAGSDLLEVLTKASNIVDSMRSTVWMKFGMPNITENTTGATPLSIGNIAEGVVVKLNNDIRLPSGKRIVLKVKSMAFCETSVKSKPNKPNKPSKPHVEYIDVSAYLTYQRCDNVISHVGDANMSTKRELGDALVIDIVKDYTIDHPDEPIIQSLLIASIKRVAYRFANDYFRSRANREH